MAKRVLIADDAFFMRRILRDILTEAGYEVAGEAKTGVEAVEMYKELAPDLVTLDIVMPEKTGIEAVKAIMEYDPEAIILMCSGMGQRAMVREAIRSGAKDFVVKPFEKSKVLGAIEAVLN
jgi:two-component system chemotaxis response regulator CheY